VLQKDIAIEIQVKVSRNSQKSNEKFNCPIYLLDYESDKSNDDEKDVYADECMWSTKEKSSMHDSLKPIHKN
jgi:hypothetical protein